MPPQVLQIHGSGCLGGRHAEGRPELAGQQVWGSMLEAAVAILGACLGAARSGGCGSTQEAWAKAARWVH